MKKALVILLSFIIIAGIVVAIWQIWFPYIFLSKDMLLEKGLYQEAWEKAENDEYAESQIIRENIVAYSCKDAINRIFDPSSFRLINAEFSSGSNYSFVLTFSANNRSGQSVVAQWEYGSNLDLNEPLYSLQYDYIDLTVRASDDKETRSEKIIRKMGPIYNYPQSYYPIGSECLRRINSLANNGGLEDVYLIDVIQKDISSKREAYNRVTNTD